MIIIDLKEIKSHLSGDALSMMEERNLTARCECGEYLSQGMDICPSCGKSVIWFNSKRWRELYGSPTEMKRRLTSIVPDSNLGKYLISRAGVSGFKSRDDELTWNRIEKGMSRGDILSMIVACERKGSRRYGLVRHALNYGRKVLREREPIAHEEDEPEIKAPPKDLEV